MSLSEFRILSARTKAETYSVVEVMQKDDSVPSAGTNADSEQKVEDIFASSNDTKPNVVGLPSSNDALKLECLKIANSFLVALMQLNKPIHGLCHWSTLMNSL